MGSKKIFIIVISVILFLAIFAFIRTRSVKKISISNINNALEKNKYIIVYSGEYNSNINKELRELSNSNDIKVYISTDEKDEVISYLKSLDTVEEITGNIYIVYDGNGYVGYLDDAKVDKIEYLKKYIYGYIPVDEREYLSPSASEYMEKYNSKEVLITVFGTDECNFCKRLEPVINDVSKSTKYKINYVNFSSLTETEANSIYSLNIIVPAVCTSGSTDKNLKDGYSKPLTIVSKNGKILGCIKGYYEYNTYLSKLEKILE